MMLYHGTDAQAAASIISHGLRVSMAGFGQTRLQGAALQESRDEAARYLGDRQHPPLVLLFEVELVRPFEMHSFAAWARTRAAIMRGLKGANPTAWQAAVDDDRFWTRHLQSMGFDGAILPSTLQAGGGREWVVFDPKQAIFRGVCP